jgi:hypothetical protein
MAEEEKNPAKRMPRVGYHLSLSFTASAQTHSFSSEITKTKKTKKN